MWFPLNEFNLGQSPLQKQKHMKYLAQRREARQGGTSRKHFLRELSERKTALAKTQNSAKKLR